MEDVIIVVSSDDNYAKYFSVLLKSIQKTADKNRNYKIFLLTDNLKKPTKALLKLQLLFSKNIHLKIKNIKKTAKRFDFFVSKHISKETYFRLFIPQIFPEYKKAIYIDVDMLVLEDIGKLFDINLEKTYLGAARNFASYWAMVNNSEEQGRLVGNYVRDVLKLKEIGDYFNAVSLLMDLEKMRKDEMDKKIIELLDSDYKFSYHDQDILNAVFNDNYKRLPSEWNIYDCFCSNGSPKHICNDFYNSLKNPKIIHFAGAKKKKVWHNKNRIYAEKWWECAYKSPFILDILYHYFKYRIPKLKDLAIFMWRYRL